MECKQVLVGELQFGMYAAERQHLRRPAAARHPAGRRARGEGREESVSRLTDSVVRNPDAMRLVTRLREKSAEAHARALQVSIYLIVFARYLQLEQKGPLSAAENEIGKRHVEYSMEILKATPGLPPKLPELAMLHHERQDGTGYPRGLKGDQIGLYGSMAALADTFDALTSARPYAEPLSPSSALSSLQGARHRLPRRPRRAVHPVRRRLSRGQRGARREGQPDASAQDPRPRQGAEGFEGYRIKRILEQSKVQVDPREMFL